MTELPLHIQKSIGRYEAIETDGFLLHPIQVEHYYEFLYAKTSLEFMQQRLPVTLMSEPLLSALYKMDAGYAEGMEATGLFLSALLALSLALRLVPDAKSIEERIRAFKIVLHPKDESRLKCLRCRINGEEQLEITPVQFQRLRPIIAAQNGADIPDESANPELVDAEKDAMSSKAPKLDITVEKMVHGAALVTGKDESEIYQWPILKLQQRLESAKMIMDYMICGIGETQGTSWKGGNPYPNPWFNRQKDGNAGLMPLESFANGQGMQAVHSANRNDATAESDTELSEQFRAFERFRDNAFPH